MRSKPQGKKSKKRKRKNGITCAAACCRKKLRIKVLPMNLMTMGFYKDPDGAYLPSILY